MRIRVDMEELQDACELISAGESAGMDAQAFVSRIDGRICVRADGIDEDVPDDLGDERTWIAVPSERKLGLGRGVVFRFVEEHMPGSLEQVERIFCKSGAYARFKDLLDDAGRLEEWRAHEQAAMEEELAQWCLENGFELQK